MTSFRKILKNKKQQRIKHVELKVLPNNFGHTTGLYACKEI